MNRYDPRLEREARAKLNAARKALKAATKHKPKKTRSGDREAMRQTPAFANPRRPRLRDPKYLAWIRGLPCVACEVERARGQAPTCSALRSDAAHVRATFGAKAWRHVGKAEKPDDTRALPLKRQHHEAQHAMSEVVFWGELDVYPPDLCRDLRDAYERGSDGAEVIRRHAVGLATDQ